MPCLGCGERDEESSGCLSRCLGRQRRAQRSRISSTGQAQGSSGTLSGVGASAPAVSRPERGQQAPQTGSTSGPSSTSQAQPRPASLSVVRVSGLAVSLRERDQQASHISSNTAPSSTEQAQRSLESLDVVRVTSSAASRSERGQEAPQTGFPTGASSSRQAQQGLGSLGVVRVTSPAALLLGRGQRTPQTSSTRQQLVLPAAAARSGGGQRATRSRSTEQPRVYSWPRRTENDQHASRSGSTRQQTARSDAGGQTSNSSGEAQHRSAAASGGTLHPASQASRRGPWLTPPARRAPAADVANTLVPGIGSVTEQRRPSSVTDQPRWPFHVLIQAEFLIAPKSEDYARPTVESFVANLALCHNTQVLVPELPHPAMVWSAHHSSLPNSKAERWCVYMDSLYPPGISAPRKSSPFGPIMLIMPTDKMY